MVRKGLSGECTVTMRWGRKFKINVIHRLQTQDIRGRNVSDYKIYDV